ncbi:(2E,6E)-farnesyl diphosphate synthase [Marinobacter daepoensis]|uniref:(2E,6E)-farnesyl diphosphate synthase n=1 Tax=Marinobacter daepoensis TaxID=262077 RepID=A0ABS3BJB8_9GAMM|nr:farnesyl diphosphate synthase [Marinobacter daepoensis]MBN7771577.1 (2E,6E)-farnesyl diphosphate synthase [Marinobacter daepoensis]MBY6080177.1 (2E,6E)-farnesyl diphosphate synthase [Marinobacter daepoensis]
MNERMTQAEAYLERCHKEIDQALDHFMSHSTTSERLRDTMRYSVLGGGKRVRPALCLAAAKAMGVNEKTALAPACALELIHAYSLVHDDLPAMDDDDLRRGRPTAHIAFDEASAILAGDALQSLAFSLLSEAPDLTDRQRVVMVSELARASGHEGMVGGQAIDLESVGQQLNVEQLETMHRHKTGALIEASVRLGALTAENVTERQLSDLSDYASALGLAFQVQDDLLDIEGDTQTIGKRQGSDAAKEKPTYPALLGIDGARQHLTRLLNDALNAIEGFGSEADTLRAMADYVVARSH